jgi:hypothetical protein
MEVITKEKIISHPLEDMFGITQNSTIVEYQELVPDPVIEQLNYDSRDEDIDGKLENIYTIAIGQAEAISDEVEMVEGKFKARLAETSAQMLNVALGAVKEKRMMKEHKDKLSPVHRNMDVNNVTNNNLVIADRNDILRMIADSKNNSVN